jgi:hypothetical protein
MHTMSISIGKKHHYFHHQKLSTASSSTLSHLVDGDDVEGNVNPNCDKRFPNGPDIGDPNNC